MKKLIIILTILFLALSCKDFYTYEFGPTKLTQILITDFVKSGNGFFIKEQTLGSKEKWKVFLYPELADEELFFRLTPNADHKHFSVKNKKKLSNMKIDISKIKIPLIHLILYDKIAKKDFTWNKDFVEDLINNNASGLFILSRPFCESNIERKNNYNIIISFVFHKNIKTVLYTFHVDTSGEISILSKENFNPHAVY